MGKTMQRKSKRKAIDIFVNGVYVCSSRIYRNCKEAVNDLKQRKIILVAGISEKEDCVLRLNPTDQITACPANVGKNIGNLIC